jgi:hypothetical protein
MPRFQLSSPRLVATRAALPLAILLLAAGGLTALGPALAQNKPRIEKAADLPRFSYRIEGKVEDTVRQAERFAAFSAAVRKDVDGVLAGYDIPDRATQRDLLTTLALLDFLDGRYAQSLARAEQVRALQDKPADKLLSGLRLRAAAFAAQQHPVGSPAHREAVAAFITRELEAAPFEVVANDVRELRVAAELAGEGRVIGGLREVLQPIVDQTGALSSDFAPGMIGARYALQVNVPLKDTFAEVFTRYLAKNQVAKADIWAARDVTLAPGQGQPVRVAVWDSGVDTALFKKQVLRDAKGQPLVIAFDKYSKPAKGELMPLAPETRQRMPQLLAKVKGLSDMESNLDTPEASEVKKLLSQLPPERFKPAMEELGLVGNYTHGTHVAGITLAGNPQARLMVARIEFGHTLQPDPCPSMEGAQRDAKAMQAYVDFFKKHQARVVNMSWGGSVADVEGDLEKCGIGKTADDRKALARRIFEIGRTALTKAMASAPQILFVAAAGNSGDDASFTESIPAGIDLPNLLTVGAVDLAGDEASFTSYGPTVRVHANGYLVTSEVPGGQRIAFSGTSMASPQVAGLAAKLLAMKPALKPTEVIQLIVSTAERTPDGRRNLMHPKKAFEAAGIR